MRVQVPEYDTYVDFPDNIPMQEVERVLRSNFPPVSDIRNPDGSWKIDITTLPKPPVVKTPIGTQIKEGISKGLENTAGLIEGLGSTISGMAAFPISTLAGAGKYLMELFTSGKPTGFSQAQEEVARDLTYQPKTQMGKTTAEVLGSPFAIAGYGIEKGLEKIPEDYRDTANLVTNVGLLAAPLLGKGIKGAFNDIKTKITDVKQRAEFHKAVIDEAKATGKTVDEVAISKLPEPPDIETPKAELPSTKLKEEIYDKENTKGLSSGINEGQAIEQTEPVKERGGGAIERGGILQAQEEVIPERRTVSPEQTENALEQMRLRLAQEAQGESVLQDLEHLELTQGYTPKKLVDDFLTKTYPQMNEKGKTYFNKLIERLYGGLDEDFKTHEEILRYETPSEFEYLEGKERGLFVLMHEANKKLQSEKPPQVEIGKAESPVVSTPKQKPNIIKFLIERGGIDFNKEKGGGYTGELEMLKESKLTKPEFNTLVRKRKTENAKSLDNALTMAKEEGYLPENATLDDLIEDMPLEQARIEEIQRQEAKKQMPLEQPKAGSLAYGQELPKYAESVNLERINADYPVKKLILDTADRYATEIKQAKQGKRTFEDTEQIASELKEITGQNYKGLMAEIKKKTDNLDAYITASRDVLNASATNLWNSIRQAATSLKPEDIQRVNELWSKHAEIQAEVGGASSKIGRALSAHRIKSSAQGLKNVLTLFEHGNEMSVDFLHKLAAIDPMDTYAINKIVAESVRPKFKDYLYSIYYNSLVSGVPTHLVNTVNNALWGSFNNKIMRALNATIDIPVSKLQGRQREYYYREVLPHWGAFKRGLAEGLTASIKIIAKGEVDPIEATKLTQDFKTTVQMFPFSHSPSKLLRKIAPSIEMPSRALIAEDLIFKGVEYRTEINRLAIRQAIKEGIKDEKAFSQRVVELSQNPTDEMIDMAKKHAQYNTFTDNTGKITNALLNLRNQIPGSRLIIPFVNTISNILKRGVEMIPGIGLIPMRGNLKGVGVTEAISKQIVGTLISLYFINKYLDGDITGEVPNHPAKKEVFYRAGMKPKSIRFGNEWYSYARLEPFNTTISSVIGIADSFRDSGKIPTDEQIVKAISNMGNTIMDASYLSGLSNFMDALERGEKAPDQFLRLSGRTITGFLPYGGALRSTVKGIEAAREGEATIRNPRGAVETIQANLPILSENVRPKRNLWGDAVTEEGGVVRQLMPYKYKTETDNKLDKEMYRLSKEGDFQIGMPSKKIQGIELNDEQYDRYIVLAGQPAKERLNKVVNSPSWDSMSDEKKARIIEGVIRSARQRAQAMMIREMLMQNRTETINKIREGKLKIKTEGQ